MFIIVYIPLVSFDGQGYCSQAKSVPNNTVKAKAMSLISPARPVKANHLKQPDNMAQCAVCIISTASGQRKHTHTQTPNTHTS